MIKSSVGHIQYNIDPKNTPFYKDLFHFLGWKVLCDEPDMLGVEDEHKASLWFAGCYRFRMTTMVPAWITGNCRSPPDRC